MGKGARRLYSGWVCKKCAASFANRRQAAFVVDYLAFAGLVFAAVFVVSREIPAAQSVFISPLFNFSDTAIRLFTGCLFNLKDGFKGKSLGRLLTGVTVLDETTRMPIGFGESFKRNLCLLIPFMPLVIVFSMMKGKRFGDGWARTRVVWDKYRHTFPFEDRGLVCQRCGYDLTGNSSGKCPECGTPIPAHLMPPPVARPVVEPAEL